MLSASAIRRWSAVHRWTSLIATAFLLLLCVTGLPLIFHDEIDQALGYGVAAEASETPPLSTEAIAARLLAQRPGRHVQFVLWDPDTPGVVAFAIGQAADSPPDENEAVYVDAADGQVLAEGALDRGPMGAVRKLHAELFLGPFGDIALGVVALLFLTALVSGVAVYAPFARREPFGVIRSSSKRIRVLDLHNLVGMATLGWALVVGATGLINSWGDIAVQVWQARELSHMATTSDAGTVGKPATIDAVVASARAAAPGMTPSFVAMPGSVLTSRSHYGVFLRGDTPLTEHLLKPVLVDRSGRVAGVRELPWYMKGLFLAQPLHFGDYGGWPLKLVWALLDLLTIYVLVGGFRLWLGRRQGREPFAGAPA